MGASFNGVVNFNDNAAADAVSVVNLLSRRIARFMGNMYGPAEDGVPIWLDNIDCKGTESSLDECPHNPFGVNDCKHLEDASIYCYSGIHTYRLLAAVASVFQQMKLR